MRRKVRNGFSLLELLVVVGIIAILATIAIFNFMGALNRGKQKRTMADMRNIAAAWEARAGDTRSYSAAGFSFPSVGVTYPALAAVLTPTYVRSLPQTDGWLRPFTFGTDAPLGGAAGQATTYGIRSAGRDGGYSGNTYVAGPTSDSDCDIVYSNGVFVAYPEGVQGKD
ncbi:MAG TPA: prepilin-type N-terminal cleavage/methylation domain-containing protein [Thermoanaerobaculia bacterium]|nr:prepilin-type N-terminal cleavage/methylation domain-containing protein [Thermoanaerobaculia bacterium]